MIEVREFPLAVTKVMTARRPDVCGNCWQPIAAQTRIKWVTTAGKAFHATCPAAFTPRPVAAAPTPSAPFRMTAKFRGRCANCHGDILPGTDILYAKPDAFHGTCEPVATKGTLNTGIDAASKLPYGTTRFAVPNESGVLTFLRIDHIPPVDADGNPRKWGGNLYVTQKLGPAEWARRGRQLAGKTYEGTFGSLLQKVLDDPELAARTYGLELGECSRCGLDLTNPKSRALGIGPVCRKAFSWKAGEKPIHDIQGTVAG